MRLVSLVPSLTHMLCDFGLREKIVGCTKFCVTPPGLARTARLVGGTKDPDLDAIRSLAPTHILVNEEENKPEHIAACQAIASTLVTFPKGPDDVPTLLEQAGTWLGRDATGREFSTRLRSELAALDAALEPQQATEGWRPRTYLYLIWREPYIVSGSDTYINRMLTRMGLVNVAPTTPRYPTLTVTEMQALNPELLFLSSEPYPFRKRDARRLNVEWGDLEGVPSMLKIDGQLMSWYGTMSITAAVEMRRWIRGDSDQSLVKDLGEGS